MSENRAKPDQYQLRFPPRMRDRLKAAADSNGRSMNAEIIDRIEYSFKGWPKVNIPDNLLQRVWRTYPEQMKEIEKEINNLAIEVVERILPSSGRLHRDFLGLFYQVLAKVPADSRSELSEEFQKVWRKIEAESNDGQTS